MAIKRKKPSAEKALRQQMKQRADSDSSDISEAIKEALSSVAAVAEKLAVEDTVQQSENKTYFLTKFRQYISKKLRNIKKSMGAAIGRRSRTARNPWVILGNFIFMLTAFIILSGALALYGIKSLYQRPGRLGQVQTILIPAGAGINIIADLLEKQGFINNAQIFIYGTYLDNKARLLKAGEYEIPANASMRGIADIFVRGRGLQHAVTVPEGMTVAQVFAKLAEDPLLTGDLPQPLPPEGSLIANTVNFIRGTPRREIVRRLSDGQRRLVQEIWAQRAADLPLKNSEEMVILASIVEKESGIAAERPHIAAVFYNRLKKNMRLQSDPTILYGLFGGQGKPADRPIYRSDLEKETAYNTYKILGLPPMPICNPGQDSLVAVANPPHTEDLYFVADGTGGHIFSKTLNEHNNNVSKWRALKKARQDAADAEKTAETSEADKADLGNTDEQRENMTAPVGKEQTMPAWSSGSGLIEETP